MVIVKSYFIKGSRIQIACQSLSKIELFAAKIKGFQCKTTATKSSTVDIPGVPDPPLITTFGKVSFNASNCHLVQFNRDLWKKLSLPQL